MVDAPGQLGFRYIQVGQVSCYYFIRLQQGAGPRGRCGSGLCHGSPVPWMGTAGCYLPGQHRDTGGLSQLCRGAPSAAGSPPQLTNRLWGCAALPALSFSTEPVPGKSSPLSMEDAPRCQQPPNPALPFPAAPLSRPSAPGAHKSQILQRRGCLCLRPPARPGSPGTCPAHPGLSIPSALKVFHLPLRALPSVPRADARLATRGPDGINAALKPRHRCIIHYLAAN